MIRCAVSPSLPPRVRFLLSEISFAQIDPARSSYVADLRGYRKMSERMIGPYAATFFGKSLHSAIDDFVCDSTGAAVCEAGCEYRPRRSEDSILYGVVADHFKTFLARQRDRDRLVPRFVERELRAFLDCGILARGFLRVHCDACGMDRLVPYS